MLKIEKILNAKNASVSLKINTNLGEEIHFVRLPNFLSVEPKPFDQQYYQDEEEEDQNHVRDEEGNARLRLKVENYFH